MSDVLSSFKEEAAKQITKLIIEHTSDPRLSDIEDQLQSMKDNIAESANKEKIEQALENKVSEARAAIESKAEAAIGSVTDKIEGLTQDYILQAQQKLDEVKSDISELGTSCGLLTTSTATFASRIAMIPPAIISATPLGPGVSANMIAPMLQQLKSDGDNLSKVYDTCNSKISKLGLKTLARNIPIVSSIMTVVDTAMGIAEKFIPLTGSSINKITTTIVESATGEIESLVEDVEETVGQMANIVASISYDYSPSDCTNFSYIVSPPDPEYPEDYITADNCSNFSPLQVEYEYDSDGNPVIDDDGNLVESTTAVYNADCNNCKNYKG